ncbi:MAG: two-component system, response regulator RegA [Candidatus Parcubacteria bacterium]|jgi:DNA-binding NtrC family response regulator|nr:two-component system, response regulator RegA [Candidatus Parcubacteria bacterium]
MSNETTKRPLGAVLIVEDQKEFLDVVKTSLESCGISCATAASVDEALATLAIEPVALVLLDWRLKQGEGEANGVHLLRFCKKLNPLMPVIVMSGQEFDVRTDAVLAQVDSFLLKPFSMTLLFNHISCWLARVKSTSDTILPRNANEILPYNEFKKIYVEHAVRLLNGDMALAQERLGMDLNTIAKILGQSPESVAE